MAIFSFLQDNDLSGKKVFLFCSHGTGGFAASVKDITAALSNAKVSSSVLGVFRDDVSSAHDKVIGWLVGLGY